MSEDFAARVGERIDARLMVRELEQASGKIVEQADTIAALTARVEVLEGALSGVLWMAEEWFKHGGDETTFADDYEAKLEAARAAITKGEGHD